MQKRGVTHKKTHFKNKLYACPVFKRFFCQNHLINYPDVSRGSTTFAISRHLKCHQQKRSLATLIKGQEAAKKILSQVSKDLEVLKSVGIKPKVVVGVVGNDPASRIYLNRKKAAALKAGLDFEEIQLPDTVQMPEMLSTIKGVVHQIVVSHHGQD